MGTPEFACPCLEALVNSRHDVKLVITQPDKPSGRGHKLMPPPVKVTAEHCGIKVAQPQSLKKGSDAETIYETLKEINPDMIVVAAYGKLLGENILDLPKYGCINVHASLLPKYRGAAPIQWSVLNGEKYSGITIMQMALGLDTGDMLKSAKVEITENETSSELHDKLMKLAPSVLLEAIDEIENKTAVPVPQNEAEQTYAPMISREMSDVDFAKPALEVHNLIRGLSDWPCAQFYLNKKRIKVYKSELVTTKFSGTAGEIADEKKFIIICGDGYGVKINELQQEGSKRMETAAFICGNKINKGDKVN